MKSYKVSKGLKGNPIIPGDKSISHRSIIVSSIANGVSEINNILKSDDVLHTLNAFKKMKVEIEEIEEKIIIHGKGLNSLQKPNEELYLGNSGTSARLLTGLLACQDFYTKLTGDKSLSSRPMKRIAEPLELMNANIITTDGKLPMEIRGKKLNCSNIDIKIPSAQVKSGIIFAALNTDGLTQITENNITRDHTEIMLKAFGANIEIENIENKKIIKIIGKQELHSKNIDVPSDLSSSAFFIVSALINKNSKMLLKNINVNPTRNGILIALEKMGANIELLNKRISNNEIVCDIQVISSDLKGCELDEDIAELMIDEYPILSIAACFASTPSVFRGLSELRFKESDRLDLIYRNLKKCGVNCKIVNDDLHIYPSDKYIVQHNEIETNYDHRIAMAFAVMGSKLGPLYIKDANSIKTSFPQFINEFKKVGGRIS